jgi:di/tripeptidase
MRGAPLPTGVKPFVDDGNTFCAHGIPCVTHGPRGSGAHTLHEQVPVAELERVAVWYALCAVTFCDA